MILIAGAGIAGLTLGCALRRTDRPFRIVERASELRPTGAGIAIAPNALRALAHVGLELPVRSVGHELRFAGICSTNGKVLIGAHVRDIAGGSNALTRADLQTTLLMDVERNVELRTAVVGAGRRFGIVPLGKGRVYWFAVADAPCGAACESVRQAVVSSWSTRSRAFSTVALAAQSCTASRSDKSCDTRDGTRLRLHVVAPVTHVFVSSCLRGEVYDTAGALVSVAKTDVANHCWLPNLSPDTEYVYKVFVKDEEWAVGERWDWSAKDKALVQAGNSYDNR